MGIASECFYGFTDGGGIYILDADSNEAVHTHIINASMYPYFHWEVKPLCDGGYLLESSLEWLEKRTG